MSALYIPDAALFAEACDVIRLYTGEKHVEHLHTQEVRPEGLTFHVLPQDGCTKAAVYEDGVPVLRSQSDAGFLPLRQTAQHNAVRQMRHQMKLALYELLRCLKDRQLPWGSLTGIRPVKLFRELTDLYGKAAAENEFRQHYLVSSGKTALAARILDVQREALTDTGTGDCVYIGIPFCPSRCRYCSFIAQDVAGARTVRKIYPDALLKELTAAPPAGEVKSVYIGGGTPTTFTPGELETLLFHIRRLFPRLRELTVEAGRPETVTKEYLRVFTDLGVGRLSINLQTRHDATLVRIGRAHTYADYRQAMQLVRENGPFTVNTDMILGLPGEEPEDVFSTLEAVLLEEPENITVHALAVKNAAALALDREWAMMKPQQAEETAQKVMERLQQAGYAPYYLYRQKYMSGNLENVGYAKKDTACLYNILNMDELASVYAYGAGAISKRVDIHEGRITRAANVKDARQYVGRIDEMIARKQQLFGIDNKI